jgi:acyl-CoA synthetase (AMP-forming)/AMP-acid ligase II
VPLWTLLESAARAQPAATALMCEGVRRSYAQLHHQARALAAGLHALGIGRGDRVAIWLPNSLLWVALLFACARIGDVLKLSGFMMSPAEIEVLILGYPGVAQCSVVGTQGTQHAEGPCAVAFVSGAPLDEGALIAWCRERIARYKVPARIIRLDAFPTTAGANAPKIQKNKLRDMARALDLTHKV